MVVELLPEIVHLLWLFVVLPVAISLSGILGGALNVGTFGAVGKGPLPSPLKQPKSDPEAVQSPTQAAFGGAFEDLLLEEQFDEEGEPTGFGPGELLSQAFDPAGRGKLFKKAKKKTKKAFATEREAGLRSFIEDILPQIRESAGARGTGVSTGTQVAGVRAGEAFLENVGTRETAALGQLELVSARAQENLFNQIINASLQQSGTTGVGEPVFGDSFLQQAGGAAGGAGALIAACWIAIALWGEVAHKTIVLRSWVLHDAPKPLLRLYQRFGPRLARSRMALMLLRPIFECLYIVASGKLAQQVRSKALLT